MLPFLPYSLHTRMSSETLTAAYPRNMCTNLPVHTMHTCRIARVHSSVYEPDDFPPFDRYTHRLCEPHRCAERIRYDHSKELALYSDRLKHLNRTHNCHR